MRKLAIFSVAIFLLVAVAGANPLLEGYAAPKDKRQLKAATSTVPLYKPTALRGWSLRGLGDSANGANFPQGDPRGQGRISRAQSHRTKWFASRTGQGKPPTPGIKKRAIDVSAWDLSNVGGLNYITNIKDQGSCGTCVSFATQAALESTILYGSKTPVTSSYSTTPDLSEQKLYYCDGGRTCSAGWWIDVGVSTAAKYGAVAESCLPYSTTRTCYASTCNYVTANVNQTGKLQAVNLNDWDSIRYHIKNYGPISTGFNVYSDFPGFQDSAFYTFSSSYVWPGTKTYKLLGGHAIMCYGFDDNMLNGVTSTSVGVLFCKNSWGTGWGANGFFKIAYGADGVMSGGGDTSGFIYTPISVTTGTTQTRTATTSATKETSMTVTRTPTQTRTPLPPKTTKAKKPPVRKLRNQVCEKPAGAAVNVLTLSCQPELYIQVTGTKYGRNGTVGDPKNKDGTCYQPGFRVTGECGNKPDSTFAQCNGYNSCQVPMNPSIVGPDLCASGTWKMLAADYDCLPADSFATVNDGTKLVTSKS